MACAVEAPAMERAGEAVAANTPADAQVGTEMRTVRIEDPGAAVVAPEQDQVTAQVAEGPHVPTGQTFGGADPEPAVGRGGKRIARAHRP